jgi:hypothetical protein
MYFLLILTGSLQIVTSTGKKRLDWVNMCEKFWFYFDQTKNTAHYHTQWQDVIDHYLQGNVMLSSDIIMQINAANGQTITVQGIIHIKVDIRPKKRGLKLRL